MHVFLKTKTTHRSTAAVSGCTYALGFMVVTLSKGRIEDIIPSIQINIHLVSIWSCLISRQLSCLMIGPSTQVSLRLHSCVSYSQLRYSSFQVAYDLEQQKDRKHYINDLPCIIITFHVILLKAKFLGILRVKQNLATITIGIPRKAPRVLKYPSQQTNIFGHGRQRYSRSWNSGWSWCSSSWGMESVCMVSVKNFICRRQLYIL